MNATQGTGGLRRRSFAAALMVAGFAALCLPPVTTAQTTFTIGANSPQFGNCYFFGVGGGGLSWGPFGGTVYKNIPAFELKPGDLLNFDTSSELNNADVGLDIALARTTVNGGNAPAQAFATVVANTQAPINPRGDTTAGNYEMQFTATAPFSFPGGGLIIRFSNPSPAYAADTTCNFNAVAANSTDSSNFFVERFLNDSDGVPPYDFTEPSNIAVFRMTLFPASNVIKLGKLKRNRKRGTATLPVEVPGPGVLSLSGVGVRPQRDTGNGMSLAKTVAAAGTVKLKIRAKGRKKAKLNDRGRVKVKVRVAYAPTGGDPATTRRRVKLIKND